MSQALVPFSRPGMSLDRQIIRRIDHSLPHYIKQEEVERMVEAAESARERLLILALWNTGGRVREVLSIRRSDFDPRGLVVRMVNEKQRNKAAEKVVYLSQDFALELLAYCEQEGVKGDAYVFPSRQSERMSRTTAWRIIRRIGQKTDVRAWPHLFRHGNAIHLLRNGVPLNGVQNQLGHVSIGTTMIYTKLSAEEMRHFISQVKF